MNKNPEFNEKQASENLSKILNSKKEIVATKNPITEELELMGVFE